MSKLSHLNEAGEAHMVDVTAKDVTDRRAVAECRLVMQASTLAEIGAGNVAKGDVFAVARVAGIQAAKRTSELIPLCHPLPLSQVDLAFSVLGENDLLIRCSCRVSGRTGVEMEALTGASVAALTVYDMCKAIDRGMRIERTELVSKEGGKSGSWARKSR